MEFFSSAYIDMIISRLQVEGRGGFLFTFLLSDSIEQFPLLQDEEIIGSSSSQYLVRNLVADRDSGCRNRYSKEYWRLRTSTYS